MPEKDIIKYYTNCLIDYENGWGLNTLYSMHNGYYDENAKTHEEAILNYNKILAEKAQITKSDLVLDSGCGVGGSSIWLAKHVGCKAIAVNIHDIQLEKGKKYAKKEDVLDKIKFVLGNYHNLDFQDNSFDVVWATDTVCHSDNKKKFIDEAYRLLKPGGRIIIADIFLIDDKRFSMREKYCLKKLLKGWAIPDLSYVNKFSEYLNESGFKNVEFTDITENIFSSFKRMYYNAYNIRYKSKFMYLQGKINKSQLDQVSGLIHLHNIVGTVFCGGIFYAKKII